MTDEPYHGPFPPGHGKARKDVPEWARERAHDLTGNGSMVVAFARYIAAHEPAPVDPLRRFVTEIVEAAVSDIHLSDEAGIDHAIEVAKAILPAAALDALGGA